MGRCNGPSCWIFAPPLEICSVALSYDKAGQYSRERERESLPFSLSCEAYEFASQPISLPRSVSVTMVQWKGRE